jgi:NAD-dependent dihydropyrimidine dehydrogenase PreA subunit
MPRRIGELLSLDAGRCFGCAACVAVCPVDALDLSNLLVIIDEPKCTHCDLCIPTCPVHALFFEKNEQTVVEFGVGGS